MTDEEMTPSAWRWVGAIAIAAPIGFYYALRGYVLAILWLGGMA